MPDKAWGFKSPFGIHSHQHEKNRFNTQIPQNPTLSKAVPFSSVHEPHRVEHQNDACLHEKCVICVSGIPEDLATVVHAWDTLPEVIKAGIVAMVNAARRQ